MDVAWIRNLLSHFGLGRRRLDTLLPDTFDPVLLQPVIVLHIEVAASSVLFVRIERSDVGVPVGIADDAGTVHHVVLVLSLVPGAVLEHRLALLHVIIDERALQGLVQGAVDVLAMALEFAIYEVAFVPDIARLGGEHSLTSLLPLFKISNVLEVSKVPHLGALPILDVILPIAFIDDASFFLNEDALTLCDTILPVTLI